MSDQQQRIRDLIRPGLEAVIKPQAQRRLAAMSSAFDNAGNLKPEALATAVRFSEVWDLLGAVTVGADVAMPRRTPQALIVISLGADAKTAPSTGEFTATLYADGAFVGTVSIENGQTTGVSPGINTAVGGRAALTWNVTAANGAADVALSAVYRLS